MLSNVSESKLKFFSGKVNSHVWFHFLLYYFDVNRQGIENRTHFSDLIRIRIGTIFCQVSEKETCYMHRWVQMCWSFLVIFTVPFALVFDTLSRNWKDITALETTLYWNKGRQAFQSETWRMHLQRSILQIYNNAARAFSYFHRGWHTNLEACHEGISIAPLLHATSRFLLSPG